MTASELKLDTAAFAATLAEDAPDYGVSLEYAQIDALVRYFRILHVWNSRLHLVAPCAPAEFARRHILESLFAAKELKTETHFVDIGSGGGLPVLPLLIARPDLRATLIEATRKKAIFLREAARETRCAKQVEIINARFEKQPAPPVAALTARALDRFTELLPQIFAWSANIKLWLLFGGADLRAHFDEEGFAITTHPIPHSERRFLFALRRNF